MTAGGRVGGAGGDTSGGSLEGRRGTKGSRENTVGGRVEDGGGETEKDGQGQAITDRTGSRDVNREQHMLGLPHTGFDLLKVKVSRFYFYFVHNFSEMCLVLVGHVRGVRA